MTTDRTSGRDRTDAELLADHVAGDTEAFGVLVARHRDRLWAVALRTTGNPDDAADGLQDGLVAGYRRAATFRGEAQVTTWLHRVVVNACLDRLRAARVRRTEALPEDLEEYGARRWVASSVPDPAEVSEREERRAAVLAALARLPLEQRAAVVLVDMEGFPVAEVASILACAEGTVKSRCSRGRARLATLLTPLLDGEEDGPAAATRRNRDAAADVRPPGATRGPPPVLDP